MQREPFLAGQEHILCIISHGKGRQNQQNAYRCIIHRQLRPMHYPGVEADRYSPELEAGIGLTDVFICSEFFFRGMYGDDAVENGLEEKLRDMAARGPRIAVVTLGARGYAGVDRAGFFTGEAFSNIAVVDTTGAGDVFHGAFLCGLLRGWDARTTARFAAGVSAVKCTVLGGRAGIPDFATAQHFLDSGEIRHDIIDQWIAYYKAEAIF